MRQMIGSPRRLTKLTLIAATSGLLLGGCGTFPLAGGIHPPPGKSGQEQQTDILVCKDRARNEANTTERQAGAFALGLTLVGAPLAFELEKKKQREVFADCMSAKGYRVLPVRDDTTEIPPHANTTPAPNITPPLPQPASQPQPMVPAQAASSAEANAPRDVTAQLEKLRDLRARDLITEEEYQAKRRSILDRL